MTYAELGKSIGELLEVKRKSYGNSFGKSGLVMRILYPEGVSHEQLDDALVVVRVLDKLFRIATDRDALGESPWRDIAGYSMLALARAEGLMPVDEAQKLVDRHEAQDVAQLPEEQKDEPPGQVATRGLCACGDFAKWTGSKTDD